MLFTKLVYLAAVMMATVDAQHFVIALKEFFGSLVQDRGVKLGFINDMHYFDPGWKELKLKDRKIEKELLVKIHDVLVNVIMKDFDNTMKYQAFSSDFNAEALAKREKLIQEKFTEDDLKTISEFSLKDWRYVFSDYIENQDMGIHGEDAPPQLVDFMVESMAQRETDLDGIIINGDFVLHDYNLEDVKAPQADWDKTLEYYKLNLLQNIGTLMKYHPNTFILPSIGNNDVIVDDNVPCNQKQSDKYNSALWDIYFKDTQMEKHISKDTFMKGGYYSFDFPGKNLTFVSFNSLYYSVKNVCGKEQGVEQLDWLEEQLKRDRNFVLGMHIFPGTLYLFGSFQTFWYEADTNRFTDIIAKNVDKVSLISGAHIHRMQVRFPVSEDHPQLDLPLLVTASVSPNYYNNPTYTTLEIAPDGQAQNLMVNSFQLQYYLISGIKTIWSQSNLGYPTKLSKFDKKEISFAEQYASEMGYDRYFGNLLVELLLTNYIKDQDLDYEKKNQCAMNNYFSKMCQPEKKK